MSRIATARWLSTCSLCKGRILYGDKIVTYTDERRKSSKKAHHLSPGCAPYTGKIVYVDSESTDLFDIKHRLRILKRINNVWAVDEISKIAKMSISPMGIKNRLNLKPSCIFSWVGKSTSELEVF